MTSIQDKLVNMLTLQNEMNLEVHKDWINQGFAWHRAIWIEASEMLEHYGWKWWKHQQPDLAQVKLEVIDIVHFCLSMELEKGRSLEDIARSISEDFASPESTDEIRTTIELLALETLRDKQAHFSIIAGLMRHLAMDFDELYKKYIGKNMLNNFRQEHGYKQGDYVKIWNGREDNEHLEDILGTLDVDSETFHDDICTALSAAYKSVKHPITNDYSPDQ